MQERREGDRRQGDRREFVDRRQRQILVPNYDERREDDRREGDRRNGDRRQAA